MTYLIPPRLRAPGRLLAALALFMLPQCPPRTADGPPEQTAAPGTTEPPTVAAAPPPAAATAAALAGAPDAPQGYVLQPMALRRRPTEAAEVAGEPGSGAKKVSNSRTSLLRGEPVSVLQRQGSWLLLRLSDGMEGWGHADAIIVGSTEQPIQVVTVFERTKTFVRPDLLALAQARSIEAGSLLFVLRQVDLFSEVNLARDSRAWVLTDVLSADAQEVQAAKLLGRARSLAQRHDPDAEVPLELAKTHFATTRLVQTQLLLPAAAAAAAAAAANPNAQVPDHPVQTAPQPSQGAGPGAPQGLPGVRINSPEVPDPSAAAPAPQPAG